MQFRIATKMSRYNFIIMYAFRGIKKNKGRTMALLVSFMLIIFSFCSVILVRNVLKTNIEEKLSKTGANTIYIQGLSNYSGTTLINRDDANEIAKMYNNQDIQAVVVYTGSIGNAINEYSANIYGINEKYLTYNNIELLYGDPSIIEKKNMVLISDRLSEKLSYKRNCVGERICLKDINNVKEEYIIGGVYSSSRNNEKLVTSNIYPEDVFVNIESCQKLKNSDNIDVLQILVGGEKKDLESKTNEIVQYLEMKHNVKNSYICTNSLAVKEQYDAAIDRVTKLFFIMTMITLFVGVIAEFNIINRIIEERKKEIGILKVLGATEKEIYKIQFLEFFAINILGGIMGAIMSLLIAFVVKVSTNTTANIGGIAIIAIVAIVFGLSLIMGAIPRFRYKKRDIQFLFEEI